MSMKKVLFVRFFSGAEASFVKGSLFFQQLLILRTISDKILVISSNFGGKR